MRRALVLMALALAPLLPTRAARAQDVPPCSGVRSNVPTLERYDQLVAGARYRVTLRHDGHAWSPAPGLGMPLHRASSLELVGFQRPPASSKTLELVVVGLERVLVGYDRSHNTWFFTYRVRVESACTTGG
ncbi:MAG: hypothetical protein IT378_08885 [Sandaracinaceae bacterium]|nr:hypothetical protein [Sandaracinaceae bacterium]